MSETPSTPIEEPVVERVPAENSADPNAWTPGRRRSALVVALVADALQWVAFPLLLWGAASVADDVLDVAVAVTLTRLIGFHWAFLPSFVAKLVPFVDLVPTWTAAVWLATRGKPHPHAEKT